MHKDWVHEQDLVPFLELLSQFCGYELSQADEDAIFHGIKETEYEDNKWFDYSFAGNVQAVFRLSKDVGTTVIFFEINASPEVETKMGVALYVLNHLRTKQR